MEPAFKSPAISSFLENLFGTTTAIKNDLCSHCGGPATDFDSELERREYTLSALCSKCQKEFFKPRSDLTASD